MVREIFAGSAELSRAWMKAGLTVDGPRAPKKGKYVPEQDLELDDVYYALMAEIQRKSYFFVHFGVPCAPCRREHQLGMGPNRKK